MSGENHAERWRRLAAEARAEAETLPEGEAKRTLLAIAEKYDLLALRANLRDGGTASS